MYIPQGTKINDSNVTSVQSRKREEYNFYDTLNSTFKDQKVIVEPLSFTPNPTETDYKRGFIYRCFLEKINTLRVIEISNSDFDKFEIPLYRKGKMIWRITGHGAYDDFKNPFLPIIGIKDENLRAAQSLSNNISQIQGYITSYMQFARILAF